MFLGFLVGGWLPLALPSAKHEVSSIGIIARYRLLPRPEEAPNNGPAGLSALARCYITVGVLPTRTRRPGDPFVGSAGAGARANSINVFVLISR